LLALLPLLVQAAPSEEELFFKSVSDVNDGDLHFLAQVPDRPVHYHQNHIVLSKDSLASGWVKLRQCHYNIDAVPFSQIVYGEGRIRDLRITRTENIERAWVLDHSVQMENIAPAALICIEAESRALLNDGEGRYWLRNGPYMRRFLDGYYPMRVSMSVQYGASGLRFYGTVPVAQPGFVVQQKDSEVGYDTWFEGRLITEIRFIK